MSGAVKNPLRALQGARSRAQGGQLEERIEASCTRLAEAGRADISKTPEPMRPVSQPNKTGQFRAVYTKKAEPDFKGVMLGGRAVMFEAKSTGTGRLNKDRVLPEQAKKLDSYEALGAHCFIVATFDGLRMYRIPWTVWRSMKQRYGRSDRRFRNTKLLLRNYTVLNANCSHAVYDAASAATGEESVEEIVEALDELLEENLKVESIMKSAARTQLIMRHVNRMLGIYKVVCENSVDEGEQRHYRVIEALYLRDRPLSPTAVAEREKIDKRTVYKDVDAACATLSALIFGIDGIKKA